MVCVLFGGGVSYTSQHLNNETILDFSHRMHLIDHREQGGAPGGDPDYLLGAQGGLKKLCRGRSNRCNHGFLGIARSFANDYLAEPKPLLDHFFELGERSRRRDYGGSNNSILLRLFKQ